MFSSQLPERGQVSQGWTSPWLTFQPMSAPLGVHSHQAWAGSVAPQVISQAEPALEPSGLGGAPLSKSHDPTHMVYQRKRVHSFSGGTTWTRGRGALLQHLLSPNPLITHPEALGHLHPRGHHVLTAMAYTTLEVHRSDRVCRAERPGHREAAGLSWAGHPPLRLKKWGGPFTGQSPPAVAPLMALQGTGRPPPPGVAHIRTQQLPPRGGLGTGGSLGLPSGAPPSLNT